MDSEQTEISGALERVGRGLLGAALLAGVVFSMTQNGGFARWSLAGFGI